MNVSSTNPVTASQLVKQAYELSGKPEVMRITTQPEAMAEKLIGVLAVEKISALKADSLGQAFDAIV